jgi:hypothetical protein
MSSAPLDGTPVRLFVSAGSAVASFWSEERSQKTFGAGDYRAGWFLFDDDVVELDNPMGWEPLIEGHACFKNETMILTPEPAPLLDEPGVVALCYRLCIQT